MIEEWNGLDFNYLHERGVDLIECEDYVPLFLSQYFDVDDRIVFLKEKKLYSKIHEIEERKRESFLKSDDKINWNIMDILDFIGNHEEYSKIIK